LGNFNGATKILGKLWFSALVNVKKEYKKEKGTGCLQYKSGWRLAPPKGCATYNGKKLPFLFLFCSFLGKLKALSQALQTLGRVLQPFPHSMAAFNFDADFHELEEIAKRALFQIEKQEPT
jgi:hypothetical protein